MNYAGVNEFWTTIKAALEKKQDKLVGTEADLLGFDSDGNPTTRAMAVPGGVATLDENGVLLSAQRPCPAVIGRRSNPNLLENWYFAAPVNQRGKEIYTEKGVMIDRWDSNSANHSVTIGGQGVTFSSTGETACWFRQKLAQSAQTFLGRPCTLSLLDTEGTLYTATLTFSTEPSIAETKLFPIEFGELCWQRFESNSANFVFYLQENTSKTLLAAKLEFGPHQTLAYQNTTGTWVLNDAPPDRNLEQLKCMQYQLILPNNLAGYACVGIGTPYNSTSALIFIPTPVPLRKKPAVSFQSDVWVLSCFGKWGTLGSDTLRVTNIRMGYYSKNGITVYCDTAGALDPSRTYLFANGSADAQAPLILDAN